MDGSPRAPERGRYASGGPLPSTSLVTIVAVHVYMCTSMKINDHLFVCLFVSFFFLRLSFNTCIFYHLFNKVSLVALNVLNSCCNKI